ncbi:MAG: methionyl-tRNA formyltransferase [Bacteroidetes bacterium 4572_77]|nr:MAG: methionyl-tRNA formyltransferase [Bacteroidetes bacterium 4572_77]
MDYNTSRNHLLIPEYGRNVQKMVEYAISIEDEEEKNALVQRIIRIMTHMNQKSGNTTDVEHKIWDHLFIISDFKLDVEAPFPLPDREEVEAKPAPIEYTDGKIKNRTYGRNLEKIVQKAIEFEEGEEKQALIALIANNLKKYYLNWNRNTVDDEQILKDLYRISDGQLVLPEDYEFPSNQDLVGKKRNFGNEKTKTSYSKGRDNKNNYKKGRSDNQGRYDKRQGRNDQKNSRYGQSNSYKKRSF